MNENTLTHLCKKYGSPEAEERVLRDFIEATKVLVRLDWPPDMTPMWWRWWDSMIPDLEDDDGENLRNALIRLGFGFRRLYRDNQERMKACYDGFADRNTGRRIKVPVDRQAVKLVNDLSAALGINWGEEK